MSLTIGVTIRPWVNKKGKIIKRRYFYCSKCWYTHPRIKAVEKHQVKMHTIDLDKFLGEINDRS